VVELGQAKVDQAKDPPRVVYQNVERFDVAVYYPVRVAKVERLEELVDVVPDLREGACGVSSLFIGLGARCRG